MGWSFGSRGESCSRHRFRGRWMRLRFAGNKKPREPFGCGVSGLSWTTFDVIFGGEEGYRTKGANARQPANLSIRRVILPP
jgi:hypothetical protein